MIIRANSQINSGTAGGRWNYLASDELPLMGTKLEPPIWVRESSFLLRAIDSAEEALLFLDSFQGPRGALFHHARLTLEGARDGTNAPSEARRAMWTFALDNNLLGESAFA
jgi:hypothetical protein